MIKILPFLLVLSIWINSVSMKCNYMRWGGCSGGDPEEGKSRQEILSKLGLLFQSKFNGKRENQVKFNYQRTEDKFEDDLAEILQSKFLNSAETKDFQENDFYDKRTRDQKLNKNEYEVLKKMDNIIHDLMGTDRVFAENVRK